MICKVQRRHKHPLPAPLCSFTAVILTIFPIPFHWRLLLFDLLQWSTTAVLFLFLFLLCFCFQQEKCQQSYSSSTSTPRHNTYVWFPVNCTHGQNLTRGWDTTCGHKATDVTPSIAWAGWQQRRKTKRWTVSLERAKRGHCQSRTVSKATLQAFLRDGLAQSLYRS